MRPPYPDEPSGVALDNASVRIERLLPGPIERVWAYLAESDKRARWLAAGELDPRVGAPLQLTFRHGELSHEATPARWREADGHVLDCRITCCEPPHLLGYTWPEGDGDDSEVTFELTPRGADVLLVITHRRLPDRAAMVSVASGWHAHVGILTDRLHGRPPRAFWSAHAAAEADYEAQFPAE